MMSLYPSANTKRETWLPLIVWMVVIFFFSTDTFSADNTGGIIKNILRSLFPSMSISQLHFWHGVIRKAGHVTEYAILGWLAWRAFVVQPWAGLKPKLFAAAFVLVFALTDEFHQMFVASRTSSLVDVGYDFMGGFITLMMLPRSRHESGTLHSHSVL
jgi:VanZ family protein